jgi:hypothetical protein
MITGTVSSKETICFLEHKKNWHIALKEMTHLTEVLSLIKQMHKSRAPGRRGDYIFYGRAYYFLSP